MALDFGFADRAEVRARRGRSNHLAGSSAETAVERRYVDTGYTIAARRWRGAGGEIDLILKSPDGEWVFVEVKKARDFDQALARILPRQVARIHAAASEFVAQFPGGANCDMRFDAALVDAMGHISIQEGVLLGY